jgi:DNA-binding transcriptional LysR family regulator
VRYPDLTCAVEILARVDWQSNIGSQFLDVAIGSLNTSTQLKTQSLCQVRIDAVMHKAHPLADKRALNPADIAAHSVIALYRGQIGRARSDAFFQSEGIGITPQFETSSSLVSLELCRQNLGITLLPSIYLHGMSDPNLISRPIAPERWLLLGAVL